MTVLALAAPLIGVLLTLALQRLDLVGPVSRRSPRCPHGGWPVAASLPASPSRRFIACGSRCLPSGWLSAADFGDSAAGIG